jgi:hypothetical protein
VGAGGGGGVRVEGEEGEVDLVAGGLGGEVEELAQLGLVGHLVEEVHQVDVVGVRPEVVPEQTEHVRLQDERIVHRHQAHLLSLELGLRRTHRKRRDATRHTHTTQ